MMRMGDKQRVKRSMLMIICAMILLASTVSVLGVWQKVTGPEPGGGKSPTVYWVNTDSHVAYTADGKWAGYSYPSGSSSVITSNKDGSGGFFTTWQASKDVPPPKVQASFNSIDTKMQDPEKFQPPAPEKPAPSAEPPADGGEPLKPDSADKAKTIEPSTAAKPTAPETKTSEPPKVPTEPKKWQPSTTVAGFTTDYIEAGGKRYVIQTDAEGKVLDAFEGKAGDKGTPSIRISPAEGAAAKKASAAEKAEDVRKKDPAAAAEARKATSGAAQGPGKTDEEGKKEPGRTGVVWPTSSEFVDEVARRGGWMSAIFKPGPQQSLWRSIGSWVGGKDPAWPQGVAAFRRISPINDIADAVCENYLEPDERGGSFAVSPSGLSWMSTEGVRITVDPCRGFSSKTSYANLSCNKYYVYRISGEAIPYEVRMVFNVLLKSAAGSSVDMFGGTQQKLEQGGPKWSLTGSRMVVFNSSTVYTEVCLSFDQKNFAQVSAVFPDTVDNPLCNPIVDDPRNHEQVYATKSTGEIIPPPEAVVGGGGGGEKSVVSTTPSKNL